MSVPYDTFNGRELGTNNIWADEFSYLDHKMTAGVNEVDWLKDFEKDKEVQAETNQQFNNQFWDRLHSEWMKISEEQDNQHPWLSEFTEYYDPYKVSSDVERIVMREVHCKMSFHFTGICLRRRKPHARHRKCL